jgi:error-prone DNA polymerase
MFVELAARTNFSFLRGGSSPQAIVLRARELGYDALGIADCDGLYGMVRALEAAEQVGLRIVVGSEVALDASAPIKPGEEAGEEAGDVPYRRAVWLHVASHEGYANLCRILTESHARHPKGHARSVNRGAARNQFAGLPIEAVCAHAPGLWCLVPPESGDEVALLKDAFGDRLSIAAWRHFDGEDASRLGRVRVLSREHSVPVCATNRALYARREDKRVLDVLHCIREGKTLDEVGRALSPNAEARLKSASELSRLFADHPAWLERAGSIADACRFSLRELKYRFPCELGGSGSERETANQALARLAHEGARIRYPGGMPDGVRVQLDKELALIEKLDVAPYFLSVQAIVEFARSRDILCQGRGSAANSAVCFCLGITAVDPARSNLLFERFLSAERREPPDIDVDFEHERREEVIQAIYKAYGRDRAAMVSEVVSYRGKSALREVGKVFGLSMEQVARMSDLVSWWDRLDELSASRVEACGFDPQDKRVRDVLGLAHAIQGFPRHLSIHVGGFVLSADPLVSVAPVEPATMPDRTIVPWDKDDLNALGFFKVDVLGLGMLSAIRKALAMAKGDPRITACTAIEQLACIPAEDSRVYDALCAADTVGVFQIESRAQMSMLPRLRPRSFYDLVIEVAIVRPGPIQGGMIHPYLRRRAGKEPAIVPHRALKPILARTLGVPLFQEQVMQIAIVAAGYTGGEADQLRRDMAAWRRSGRLELHRERLLQGFEKNDIPREFGERLYKSIEGFGEYGFPESHAASFAHLVYASAWLKVHHPAAFAAALINSQPMGFYSTSSIVKDAERHGVEVRRVSVIESDWDCTLDGTSPALPGRRHVPGFAGAWSKPESRNLGGTSPALRLGLRLVGGLGVEVGRRIERARRERPFTGVEDLAFRAEIREREVELLAKAGALSPFGFGRREAIWKVRAPRERDLFAGIDMKGDVPELAPMSRAQQLVLDYRATGVAVGDHAMTLVRTTLPKHFKSSTDLASGFHGTRVSTAGLVICRQRPQTASGVVFVTLEDETGFINLILWPKTFERWRHVATTSTLLAAHGKIERQDEVVYVVPDRLERLELHDVPAMSRDFH